jgi:hypothetical protein
MFHRLRVIGCTLLALLLLCQPLLAQDRETRRPAVKFALPEGGGTNFVYYLPDNPGDYPRIIDILETTLPVYNTLRGGIPWVQQIIVVFTGSASPAGDVALGRTLPPSAGYVTRLEPTILFDPTICHLSIYSGWENAPDLESTIARELFHCVQAELASDLPLTTYLDPAQGWWVNGSADWAAAQVFPGQYPSARQINFDQRQDITTTNYEALYFWEFAATASGMGSIDYVRNELRVIAARRSDDSLFLGLPIEPTELFHNWLLALHQRSLPIPPVVDLTSADTLAAQSGSADISLPRFSGDFVNLVGFEVQPGNIAFVQANGSATRNYAVSIETSSGLQRLTTDTPLEFCPSASGDMVIISRGRAAAGERNGFTLTWGQLPSATPCSEAQPTAEPTAASTCYLGDWQITGVPAAISGAVDTTGYVFSLADDGTFTGVYALATESMTATFAMTGTYRIVASATDATRFTAQDFHAVYGDGSAIMTDGGAAQDITEATRDVLNNVGNFPVPFNVVCDGERMVWTVNGNTFTLARLTP